MATETAVDVVMPQMGVSVSEGTITKWNKQVGDTIDADETLLEISTDKVDTEVPSPAAGVVTEILVPEGETVDVGTVLARIGGEGAAAAPPAPSEPATQPAADAAEAAASEGQAPVEVDQLLDHPAAQRHQIFPRIRHLDASRDHGRGVCTIGRHKSSALTNFLHPCPCGRPDQPAIRAPRSARRARKRRSTRRWRRPAVPPLASRDLRVVQRRNSSSTSSSSSTMACERGPR